MCLKNIEGKRSNAIYCSGKCRTRAYRFNRHQTKIRLSASDAKKLAHEVLKLAGVRTEHARPANFTPVEWRALVDGRLRELTLEQVRQVNTHFLEAVNKALKLPWDERRVFPELFRKERRITKTGV